MAEIRKIRMLAVRILCVLALVFLGLSHRMPVPERAAESLVLTASLTLPDGSVADLCLPSGHAPEMKVYPECDACRLSASTLLPEPPAVAFYALHAVDPPFAPEIVAEVLHPFGKVPPVRGPPANQRTA